MNAASTQYTFASREVESVTLGGQASTTSIFIQERNGRFALRSNLQIISIHRSYEAAYRALLNY